MQIVLELYVSFLIFQLTWFKDGQRLRDSQKIQTTYSNNQAQLRVHDVSASDSGHYSLLTENPQGCTVTSAYLAVEITDQVDHVPVQQVEQVTKEFMSSSYRQEQKQIQEESRALAPNFLTTCSDREVTEGKMVKFECRITGRPYPEVTWLINGFAVRDDLTHKILVNEQGEHSLMITSASRNDAGIVTCVARNKAGESSFECMLNVVEKEQVVAPKFVERFTTTTIKEGEPVTFSARAVATPPPRITWQKVAQDSQVSQLITLYGSD